MELAQVPGPNWWPGMEGLWGLLGCPYCEARLQRGEDGGLACQGCGRQFPVLGGIPALLRQEDAARFERFSEEYRQARLREGLAPLSAKQTQALPHGQPAGYPPLYWKVRRQTFCAFMSTLAREGPTPACGPAADVGAGTGWLSYRLAELGYQVVAIEASRDEVFGLGAAQIHFSPRVPFLPVQGNLERLPLLASTFALIVFNASLHYARDLEESLLRAARALRPGGALFVLDTPIAQRPQAGTGRGDRHLGRNELHAALLAAGLRPRWLPVRRGPRWWAHQAKALVKGEPLFSFPMMVACKHG